MSLYRKIFILVTAPSSIVRLIMVFFQIRCGFKIGAPSTGSRRSSCRRRSPTPPTWPPPPPPRRATTRSVVNFICFATEQSGPTVIYTGNGNILQQCMLSTYNTLISGVKSCWTTVCSSQILLSNAQLSLKLRAFFSEYHSIPQQLMRNLYGHQSHSSHASASGHSPNPHVATAAAARGGFPHYPSSPTFGAMTRYGELNSVHKSQYFEIQ